MKYLVIIVLITGGHNYFLSFFIHKPILIDFIDYIIIPLTVHRKNKEQQLNFN